MLVLLAKMSPLSSYRSFQHLQWMAPRWSTSKAQCGAHCVCWTHWTCATNGAPSKSHRRRFKTPYTGRDFSWRRDAKATWAGDVERALAPFLWNIVHLRRARCESVVSLWMNQSDTPIHWLLKKQFATWTSLRIEWLRQTRRTEERVSRQGYRGGCWGGWGVYRPDWGGSHQVWDVIALRRRRTVTADLVVKPVSNQIRSVWRIFCWFK